MRIRDADVSDTRAIVHVHRLSRAAYHGVEVAADADDGRDAMWASLVVQPRRRTLLAEVDDHVVGFTSMVRSDTHPGSLELTALYVLPDRFGAGVGSCLHGEYEHERRPGEPGVLEVWAANARTVEFYRRRGWTPTADHRPGPDGRPIVIWVLEYSDAH